MINYKNKICVIYSHHKLGDIIWQLPYIKSISEHHEKNVTLITRPQTQAKDIFKDIYKYTYTYICMYMTIETNK